MTTEGFSAFQGLKPVSGSDNFWRDFKDKYWDPNLEANCAAGIKGFFTLDGWLTEYDPKNKVCLQKCPTGWEPVMTPDQNFESKAPGSDGFWQCAPSKATMDPIIEEIVTPIDYGNKLVLTDEEIASLPDGSQVKEILLKDKGALDGNYGYLQEAARLLPSFQVRVALTDAIYNSLEYPDRYSICNRYSEYTADPINGRQNRGGEDWLNIWHQKFQLPYVRGPAKTFVEDLPNAHCPTDDELMDWRLKYGDLFEANQKAERQKENEEIFQAEQAEQRRQNELKDDPCKQYDVIDPRRALCEAGKAVDDATGIGDAWSDLKWIVIVLIAVSLLK